MAKRSQSLEGTLLSREYSKLRGVDFSDDETLVNLSRSPNAVNVWKDYNSSLGQAVETRAGFRILKHIVGNTAAGYYSEVIGLHTFKINDKPYFFAHVKEHNGTAWSGKLYRWTNYPEEKAEKKFTGNGTATTFDLNWQSDDYTNYTVTVNGEDAKSGTSVTGGVLTFAVAPENNAEIYVEYGFSKFSAIQTVGYKKSGGFLFNQAYYFLDGESVYVLSEDDDGNIQSADIVSKAFIPTTAIIGKDGTMNEYQDYNALTGKQKNEYTGDGTRKEYTIFPAFPEKDVTVVSVEINGEATTAYTVSDKKLTFTTAPTDGATVVVTFSQAFDGAVSKMLTCDKAAIFDNRVFLANCPTDKTKFFFSALNDPTYFPATNFEQAGVEELDVVDLVVMSSGVALVKEGQGGSGYLYSITGVSTADEIMPKAYRASLIASSIGGVGAAINFKNDIVFLSKLGLQAITQLDLHNERNIAHRSSLVDGKLINENALYGAKMAVYNDYLMILVDGKIYLANSREMSEVKDVEYEWYYWDNVGVSEKKTVLATETEDFYNAVCINYFDGGLYLGTADGCVLKLNTDMFKVKDDGVTPIGTGELISTAYQDDCLIYDGTTWKVGEKIIYSCWCTAVDDFGYRNRFKRCNKRGGIADLKAFSHSATKLSIKTDTGFYADNSRHNSGYFDFSDIDFEDFTFNTSDKNEYFFKAKNKKWARISLKFYSDELRKPFGIFGVIMEAFVQGYAKERLL